MSQELELLLLALDQAYDQHAWHGTNLRGSLRGLRAEAAAWRPSPDRHNAWELAVHAAYWKYVVRCRLLGERGGKFPLVGSNFFRRPEGAATEAAWKNDRDLLADQHRQLRATVVELDPARLGEPLNRWTVRDTILGAAFHDVYHAGQIQLLRRLGGEPEPPEA